MGESETEPLSSPEDDNSPQVRYRNIIVVVFDIVYSYKEMRDIHNRMKRFLCNPLRFAKFSSKMRCIGVSNS